jgi:hypothetical protein
MDSLTPIGILALVLVGVWLWLRHTNGRSRHSEKQLRRICLGDDRKMERLINAEMIRAPGIARGEAASRAVYKYQRDNH